MRAYQTVNVCKSDKKAMIIYTLLCQNILVRAVGSAFKNDTFQSHALKKTYIFHCSVEVCTEKFSKY